MKRIANEFPIKRIAEALDISRAGHYRKIGDGPRAVEDAHLTSEISKVFAANKERYGSPRIYLDLRSRGFTCGENRVARLMRCKGLKGISPRKKGPQTTDSKHNGPIAPNILKEMELSAPNQAWAMDITYVNVDGSWAYLSAVLDMFLHQIIGWELTSTLHAAGPCSALKRAMQRQGSPEGVVIHSDRGCQYASKEFIKLSSQYDCVRSMSAKGNCYDNATMESFFGVLKREELDRHPFRDIQHLRTHVFEYIETYYNRNRIHTTLGMGPALFEKLYYEDAPSAEFSQAWVDPMVEKKAGGKILQPRPTVSTSSYPANGCSPAEPSSVSPDTVSIQQQSLELKH
jgi:transposase InsO family protein